MEDFQHLAENEHFKVYSIYESVYLKNKLTSSKINQFDSQDLLIAHHYGDPTGGIIVRNFIVVSGCGLSIYEIKNKKERHILDDPNKITWTTGLHIGFQDDTNEVRFVTWNEQNQLRVFKINLESEVVTELEE